MANLSKDIESYDSAKLSNHREKDEEKEKPANNDEEKSSFNCNATWYLEQASKAYLHSYFVFCTWLTL